MATSDAPLSVPDVTLAVARGVQPATGQVVDNADGTITISGSGFGNTGPKFVCNLDGANAVSDTAFDATDTILGPGCTIDTPDGLSAELEPKLIGGKGIIIGSNRLDLNGGFTASLNVDHPNTRRCFESRTTYLPRDHAELIVDYRDGTLPDPDPDGSSANDSWQIKPVWNWTNREDGGVDTDFYFNLIEATFPIPGGVSRNVKITSNSTGLAAGALTATPIAVDQYKGNDVPLDEPITTEYAWDQGPIETATDQGTVWHQAYYATAGVQSEAQDTNIKLADPGGPVKEINGFGYPGFIRGYSKINDNHFLETQIFRSVGPGAYCRVALCNNADYFVSTKRVLLPTDESEWADTVITSSLPLWAPTLAEWSGWFLCVVDIDNTQVGTGEPI